MTLGQRFQAWLKESMTLFKREYAATMAFVFAMGAVFGGFAFSPDTGIPHPEDGGHAAEWLAAFGTLAVGYMAWRIASASHTHNEQTKAQQDRIEARKQYAEAMRFSAELVRVMACASALKDRIARVTKGALDQNWSEDLETANRLIKDQALGYTVLALLDDRAIAVQDMLRFDLVEVLDSVDKAKRFFESNEANNPDRADYHLTQLSRACASLEKSCTDLDEHVDALITRLREQL